jgi:hypothetical protein
MQRYFVVILAALAGVLAACGDTVSLNPVARAAERTQHVDGVRITMTSTGSVGTTPTRSAMSGVFNADHRSGRITMTFTGSGSTFTLEEILEGSDVYVRGSAFEKLLPAGKHWLHMDVNEAGKGLGINLNDLLNASPQSGLEQLMSTSKDVAKIGTESIGGVTTTHYRATVDPSKSKLLKSLDKIFHFEYGPVDAWIDAKQRVRRSKVTLTSDVPGAGQRLEQTSTTEYSDYGIHVDVKAPPAAEVAEFKDVLGGSD